jgi:hypothetical protein
VTRGQKLSLINSLALAPERRAQRRHAGTDGCRLCLKNIEPGECYRDRGAGRRAHTTCVEQETRRAEH